MWLLRRFHPVSNTLSSHFVPLLSSQPRSSRTIVAPAAINATPVPRSRWSSMPIFPRGGKSAQSILTSIPQTIIRETRRCMSKFLSKSATKRLPLTTKRARKGYYKGKGCTSEGRLTSKGKFIADPRKKLQLIVPDLTGFTLKPYIARTVAKSPPTSLAGGL